MGGVKVVGRFLFLVNTKFLGKQLVRGGVVQWGPNNMMMMMIMMIIIKNDYHY